MSMLPTNPNAAIADAKTDKTTWQNAWNVCISYVFGKQDLVYNVSERRFVTPQSREITFNLLLNLYRNIVSRLSVAYPNVAVVPASTSYEDILKAKASEQALRYIWNEDKLADKYQELSEWLVIAGSAGMYTYYDPDKDDVCVKVVSPYDLYYEKYALKPSESSWVAVREYVNKEDFAAIYPDFADFIKEQPTATRDYNTITGNGSQSLPKDTIEIFNIYGSDNSYGISVNNTYVYKGEIPKGIVPVTLIKYTDIPMILWGQGMIFPLIDIQTQYNKTRNQIIRNTELMTNPKWLIPKSSGVSLASITDQPGEKIYYNPAGGAPSPIGMPALPSYINDSLIQLQNEMYDISGVHSVSLGKRVTGLSSGKAIENLSALDASQLQVTQNNIENATKVIAKNILLYMKNYYKESKYLKMFDNSGKFIYSEIKATDIVDNPEVFIDAGTLFQDDVANRENRIMQQFQAGLMTAPEAREQLFFRTNNTSALDQMANMSKAKKILDAITMGDKVEIYLDDDLEVFQRIFKEFMTRDDDTFYELPKEIQDYISDLYKAILIAKTKNTQASAQGLSPTHDSIMPSIGGGSPQEVVESISGAFKSPITQQQAADANIENAQRQAELKYAEKSLEQPTS